MEITSEDMKILNSIIKEYSEKKFVLLGIKDNFPEVISDIEQKQKTLLKIERIIKCSLTHKTRNKYKQNEYTLNR